MARKIFNINKAVEQHTAELVAQGLKFSDAKEEAKKTTHAEWLELRKSGIGGSDSGAVVGMNQYSSQITLYAEKKGMSKVKETTEAMQQGIDLEQYVAERFCKKEGKKVINDTSMYADDEYDFLRADIDRKVVGENAGLECKTMNSYNGYNLEAGEIPSHYYCQCQHYMMVMGYERMYLAILVYQRGFYVIPIERDDDFIKSLRKAEIDFWTHYVEKGIIPAPDGSEASLDTLKQLYPSEVKHTEIAIPGLDQMIKNYKALKEMADDYSKRAESVKAQICALMGDNEVGRGDDYGCSWETQSRASVDTKRLKAKYPDVYKEVVKVSSFRKLYTRQLNKKEK